ncbi:LCP family protein [Streptomyces sp. J2-1]|uniref:LCP family protein n=1 Tax=Streptomyces corallincola TaxID=2851888 RepID=UPI001C38F472|nr:LCP family protein [Streptomyces corallincola]MBV2357314.1 LCP family protein [Streptomyces corallincola]
MNDRYDAGDSGHGGDPWELVGYDEYGQPVYRQVPAQQPPQHQPYDPYGQQPQAPYGYDPYGTGGTSGNGTGQTQAGDYNTGQTYGSYDTGQQPQTPYGYDPYGTGGHQNPYGQQAGSPGSPGSPEAPARPARTAEQTAYIPQQPAPAAPGPDPRDAHDTRDARDPRDPHGEPAPGTEEFAFAEEPDGDSEDVIDWLKFTENRTERREEARRRARSRIIALLVVLVLVVIAGAGYLWYAGKLPFLASPRAKTGAATPVGAQKRDVIAVHLHNTGKGGTSTLLLVDNTTTRHGTVVLLPNSLALSGDDGSTTTLAKSVDDDGASGTRDQLDSVLGTDIQGSWRLDTPYLQNLVDLVGGIDVDANADVPDPDSGKKGAGPLVHRGKGQSLSGRMAVAYATYRAAGESQDAQLERFGQVMQGALRKISSDASGATVTVQTLAQILDPPLTDQDLGAFLARFSALAKGGDSGTALLPVRADGTLDASTGDSVVKTVLGGTAKSPDAGSAVRVSVQNATGVKDDTEQARVVLLNGGFTFLGGGTADSARTTSEVRYADAKDKENAAEVAKTLGLPAGSVAKGTVSSGADVSVVLGTDYRPPAR